MLVKKQFHQWSFGEKREFWIFGNVWARSDDKKELMYKFIWITDRSAERSDFTWMKRSKSMEAAKNALGGTVKWIGFLLYGVF